MTFKQERAKIIPIMINSSRKILKWQSICPRISRWLRRASRSKTTLPPKIRSCSLRTCWWRKASILFAVYAAILYKILSHVLPAISTYVEPASRPRSTRSARSVKKTSRASKPPNTTNSWPNIWTGYYSYVRSATLALATRTIKSTWSSATRLPGRCRRRRARSTAAPP